MSDWNFKFSPGDRVRWRDFRTVPGGGEWGDREGVVMGVEAYPGSLVVYYVNGQSGRFERVAEKVLKAAEKAGREAA